jgi:hypothetical protein
MHAALADYYGGLLRLRDGDREGFAGKMRSCAAARGFPFMQEEIVIARLESASSDGA